MRMVSTPHRGRTRAIRVCGTIGRLLCAVPGLVHGALLCLGRGGRGCSGAVPDARATPRRCRWKAILLLFRLLGDDRVYIMIRKRWDGIAAACRGGSAPDRKNPDPWDVSREWWIHIQGPRQGLLRNGRPAPSPTSGRVREDATESGTGAGPPVREVGEVRHRNEDTAWQAVGLLRERTGDRQLSTSSEKPGRAHRHFAEVVGDDRSGKTL